MKRKFLLYAIIGSFAIVAACKKDNYKTPDATISGRVVYNGQPLGLRSNGVQLEVWQHGYQLFSKIPVNVAYDGTFSVALFDGDYKLTLLRGNGPWADKTDSINVTVKGNTTVDVPVDPYFIIKNESFVKSGTTITGTLTLQRVNTSKALEAVRVYIGQTMIVDQTNNAANASKAASTITDLTQPVTVSVTIPASLATKDYVFARVGVKTIGVGELVYSASQKINLK
jgi:hypothetical protein